MGDGSTMSSPAEICSCHYQWLVVLDVKEKEEGKQRWINKYQW